MWHKRLGHPTNEIARCMLKNSSLVTSDDFKTDCSVCEACLLRKFHKLPFHISQSKAEKPFEVVCSYVWGPSPYLSLNGFKYFVLFYR